MVEKSGSNLVDFEQVRRVVAYVAASFLGLAVDLGGLFFLHDVVGVTLTVASATSFLASCVVNFSLNQRVTFKAATSGSAGQAIKFAVLVGANTLVTSLVVAGLAAVGVNYMVAKMFTVVVLFFVNFIALRKWVFAASGDDAPTDADGRP